MRHAGRNWFIIGGQDVIMNILGDIYYYWTGCDDEYPMLYTLIVDRMR
jgi:hypothetical protein